MLRVGSKAPEFAGTLDDGRAFRLSDLFGRKNIVLYFYPRAFSSGCTREACSFRDSDAALMAHDAAVIGVSRDSVASQKAFKAQNGLAYPMLSDPDSRIEKLYEVRSRLPVLRPRVTYVIDKQGVIRGAFRHDIAVGRHLKDALAALEEIDAAA